MLAPLAGRIYDHAPQQNAVPLASKSGFVISKDGLSARIRDHISRVADPERRAAIQAALIDPRQEVVEWGEGDMPAAFRCWIFGAVPERELELAYCDLGSGPPGSWGALLGRGRFGAVSQWYHSLDLAFDAYFEAKDSGW